MEKLNLFSNHIKNVVHGFFVSVAVTVAEPSTILPLIVHYFSQSTVLVGVYTFLLKGGSILVQLVAAYFIQSHKIILPLLRRVFLARFLSWFFIGVFIILFGKSHPSLTLFLIALGLFFFSFAAGFGAIFYNEISAKMFTKDYLGFTMGYRQFFASLGSIVSGVFAGFVLERFSPPFSFGYLFIISSLFMGVGLLAFSTVKEPVKERVAKKEKSFKKFIKNALLFLKSDDNLKNQILSRFFANGYLTALPFIILQAKEKISLGGGDIAILITSQMVGSMLSNILWGKLSFKKRNKEIIILSLLILIFVMIFANFCFFIYQYAILFFLMGAAIDGMRLGFGNLIMIISPQEFRPTYIALQVNISSLGLLFSVLGGFIVKIGYLWLYLLSLFLLCLALYFILRLRVRI